MAGEKTLKVRDSRLRPTPRWWRRLLVASRKANLAAVLEILAYAALIIMLLVNWFVLTGTANSGELMSSYQSAALLVGTLIPALSLIVLTGRKIAIRRAAGSTARLHVRLVFFFSMIAAVPTLLVAVFASVMIHQGVQFWFSDENRGVLENANQLAENIYQETQLDVAQQTITMAGDLRYELQNASIADPGFEEWYTYQVLGRELGVSALIQRTEDGRLLTAIIVSPDNTDVAERVTTEALARVDGGESVVAGITEDRVEAITAVDRRAGIYLYNARTSDVPAFEMWQRAQRVSEDYDALTASARSLQLRFNIALFGASLALVGVAVWFALRFADRQVQPLTELVSAAREVGAGNYALRVEGRRGPDEIGLLNRAFNRMTAQIEQQNAALVGANTQLHERRVFIETVLESITAGIVSLDDRGRILLMNSSAQSLLYDKSGPAESEARLVDTAPQIAALVDAGLSSGLVQYSRDGELLTLAVKVAGSGEGHVVTFEDITRQILDQRQAAWSDVARRIAHEIKNPLTPIQLATERLNRRYLKQIEQDRELFEELTGTIIRQVGDLRRMVDEFSSFARLPKPVFRQEGPIDLVRQALFLQEVARPEVNFSFEAGPDIPAIECDRHQFGQAMTNVLKNAAEAVEARAKGAEPDYRGRIEVRLSANDGSVTVTVEDNGIGLPQDGERIAEPYVTTREKGTGLGLAIVKKIVEEHGGEMQFASVESGGTRVSLRFARDPLAVAGSGSEAAE